MTSFKILKLLSYIAFIVFTFAAVVWGIRMTIAVGNLYVEVKVLEQRVKILSTFAYEKDTDGTIQDAAP